MKTYAEQKAFFDKHAPAIREQACKAAAPGVVDFIRAFTDPLERRVLFVFVRQAGCVDAEGRRSLDWDIEVAQAGIEECLAQASQESSEALRLSRTDTANVISYNLAADLADCWPEDGTRREKRHFTAGLTAAQDCIRWRRELDKPAYPRSIAWWARGMHELSLERAGDSSRSFQRSLDYAREASDGDEAAFSVVLGKGYLALADLALGKPEAQQQLDSALGTFKAQLQDENKADDAQFGLEQLEIVKERYA